MRSPAPPPDPPPGWTTGPPDYVGVGAQRCGTTWWDELVADHPGVDRVPGAEKELHFFDRFVEEPPPPSLPEAYARHFPRRPGALAGEWTPRYLVDHWTPPLLARCAPAARVLVILRDPVERYRSGMAAHRESMRRRGQGVHPMAAANHVLRGLYDLQLGRLLGHVPRERVLVLLYERCIEDPAGELARTYRFLGLDPGHRPAALARRANAAPEELKPAGDPELAALFAADVRALAARFPELDLGRWPTAQMS